MKKVLIVDDDLDYHILLIHHLESMGIIVLKAENGEDGLKMFIQEKPKLTISDTNMPIMDGPEMVKKILKINPQAVIISCSGCIKPNIPFPPGIPFFQKLVKIKDIKPFL